MAGPTYKSRDDYRTRRSGDEIEALAPPGQDFAATALDRPTASLDDLKQAALKQRVEQERRGHESKRRTKRALLVALLVALAIGLMLGVVFGAYLALS